MVLFYKLTTLGGIMASIEVDGKSFEVDDDSYLIDWQEWNENIATHMSKEEGLDLKEDHWEIIRFLRDYFQKYQIAPTIKILIQEIRKTFGPDKGNTKYLYELYPAGPAKQACKYAGLPNPVS